MSSREAYMTVSRAAVMIIVALGFLVAALATGAQQPPKVPRIGYLSAASAAANSTRIEALRQGLGDLGYAENRNISFEYRFAEGKPERLSDLAAELVRLNAEVIIATGNEPVRAAKNATPTIPIGMAFSADPVADGFVASLARPGGNVTGLTSFARDLSGKRLELLREVIPRASRIAVIWNPANPGSALEFRETEIAARALGVRLQSLEVREARDFESTFKAATRPPADALIVVADHLTISHRARIVDFAA
jgi:putative ABC transport system substrate-binding protein